MNGPHREFCRKQHRVLGHFLAVLCWRRGLDCIAVDRACLQLFLDISRFKSARLRWLIRDIEPWFPHHTKYVYSGGTTASIFLSRVPIEAHLSNGRMSDEERIELMGKDAPRAMTLLQILREKTFRATVPNIGNDTARVYIESEGKKVYPPSEREIVSFLALLAAGLKDP